MDAQEQWEADKLALLRAAWKEGIDSGDDGKIAFAKLKREAPARLASTSS